jgi:hypothetical protein
VLKRRLPAFSENGAPKSSLSRGCVVQLLRAVRHVQSRPLLDLRSGSAYELGVDTDSSRARDHTAGQASSQAVHDELLDVSAILFNSQLTTSACVAIYDRAFFALWATAPIGLMQAALLPAEIAGLGVTLRRKRGYAS